MKRGLPGSPDGQHMALSLVLTGTLAGSFTDTVFTGMVHRHMLAGSKLVIQSVPACQAKVSTQGARVAFQAGS